jgi:hypothetical protein
MPSGGPRRPSSPAPVSGPGRLSRRTDGGPTQTMRDIPDAAYGEQQAYTGTQRDAGLALADGALSPSAGGGGGSPSPVPVTPLGAPSQYPDQPVTNGSALGPGAGFESLGISNEQQLQEQDRQNLVQYLPVLEYLSNLPSAMPSLRAQVRKIKAANGI